MSSRASRTLYVGNLPGDIREREVEDLFYKVNSSPFFFWGMGFLLGCLVRGKVPRKERNVYD